MVAGFDAVRFMGVGRIFSREWDKKWIFSVIVKNIYPGRVKGAKIHFTHSKLRKRLLAKNLIGKCQFSNSRGGKPPMHHFRRP